MIDKWAIDWWQVFIFVYKSGSLIVKLRLFYGLLKSILLLIGVTFIMYEIAYMHMYMQIDIL